ncbi:MAG TPA: molybdopterin-dependent oxidoreductase [Thermoanaerobaculia bacterium]|nr:molybdopterin-dependent oxidoreductase [Thermoanaerobaculia bacterium]
MTENHKGRLSRRDLFRLGMVAGPAALAASCGWDGGPIEPGLRRFSRLNDWVGEKLLLSDHRLARQYPRSARTPERDFPIYAQTNPLPTPDDPDSWTLSIEGLVRQPQELTLAMVQALPRITYTVKHHCVEGWSAIATWTGAPLSSILALADPLPEARYLKVDTFDSDYSNGWDLKSAMHPQTILAYGWNDRPLGADHGGPLRLYSPIKLGYKLTKYVSSLTFTTERPGGYWEDQGYPWLGGV